jgi:hypothetical protein
MIGKFLSKVKEIGISKTKDNLPQVVATIVCHPSIEDAATGAKPFEKVWYGSLKGQAAPITLQTLMVMGYKFSVPDLSDIANGTGVDFNKEFECVIEDHTWEGKTSERIKGIFEVGAAGFAKLNPVEAVNLMKGVDINGTVMSFMNTKGIKPGGAMGTPAPQGQYADAPGAPATKPW